MLIKFFRSSFLIHYLALMLLGALIWVPGFYLKNELPVGTEIITPIYNAAHFVLGLFGSASPLAALIIVFISALTLNNIMAYHDLTPKNDLLPAFLFILFFGSNPNILCSYPVIIALPFFTWFLHTVYKMNDEPENYMEVFNASILVSIISMIYPIAIFLWLFIGMALLIYGSFSGRNLLVSIMAVIIPYLYLTLYYFWNDRLYEAASAFLDYYSGAFDPEMNRSILQMLVWAVFAIFMLLPAFLRISSSLSAFNINYRKKMAATVWFMVFCLPMIIFSGKIDYHTLLLLPAIVMIAHYYHLFKKSVLNEITLLIFLILVLLNNYLNIADAFINIQ